MDKIGMVEEIKPCPFCGGRAHILEVDLESSVRCASPRECRIAPATDWSVDENQLIEAWNTRKPEPDYKAMWEELKDFAKKAPPHEPAWHIAWGAVVEKMRDLETAGPARKGEVSDRRL